MAYLVIGGAFAYGFDRWEGNSFRGRTGAIAAVVLLWLPMILLCAVRGQPRSRR